MKGLGLRLKKPSTPPSKIPKRGVFGVRTGGKLEQIDAASLIFLDESGVTTEMTRRWGRTVGGARYRTPCLRDAGAR